MGQTVKSVNAMRETQVQSLGWEDPLQKEIATHSSILAWEIPSTEEPGSLQSMGHKELVMAEQLCTHTHIFIKKKLLREIEVHKEKISVLELQKIF